MRVLSTRPRTFWVPFSLSLFSPIPRLAHCSSVQCSWLLNNTKCNISMPANYWLLQHDLSLSPKSESQSRISERLFLLWEGGLFRKWWFYIQLTKGNRIQPEIFFGGWGHPRKWPDTPNHDFPLMELKTVSWGLSKLSSQPIPFLTEPNVSTPMWGWLQGTFPPPLRLAVYIPDMHANVWCNWLGY